MTVRDLHESLVARLQSGEELTIPRLKETLKEITKLAIPVVKEKIRGDERKVVGKGREKAEKGKPVEAPKEKDMITFAAKKKGVPLRVTKVKFKSQKDIEEELENLAKDFTGSKK